MNFSASILLSATCIFLHFSMRSMEYLGTPEHATNIVSPRSQGNLQSPFLGSLVNHHPLITAISDNNFPVFETWLANNILTNDYEAKQSPLHWAIKLKKRNEFIKVLLENGAIIQEDDLKIIIDNPTHENYTILEILVPYLKQQKFSTSEMITLFNEPYALLEKMQILLDPDAGTISTPRIIQNDNGTPQRYFVGLAIFAAFLSYYAYICYGETRNIHKTINK